KTLFYLDPPYFGFEDSYGKGMFSRDDFRTMAEILRDIKGSFLLSIGDRPEIREIFAGFRLDEVETKYSLGSHRHGDNARVTELLISG
ncbi:MAG: DNA adenine methylase, partial [Alphaproteobacteria bacterium]|nr:DNA adenine methylase [Alphaproteobacteria bacterium]